jgi:hypothetical protein
VKYRISLPLLFSRYWSVALRTWLIVRLLVAVTPRLEMLVVTCEMELAAELAEVHVLLFAVFIAVLLSAAAHEERIFRIFLLLVADLSSWTSRVLFHLGDWNEASRLISLFSTPFSNLSFASWNHSSSEAVVAADALGDGIGFAEVVSE